MKLRAPLFAVEPISKARLLLLKVLIAASIPRKTRDSHQEAGLFRVLKLVLIIAFAPFASAAADNGQAGEQTVWVSLFDGKTLNGWVQRNGTAKYRVEDGTIVGKTNEGSPNSFLCTKKDYCDFELLFEVKVDNRLNSGVQIRSKSKKDYKNFRVHGPQVEIATNGTAGFVYGEALGTGWLSKNRKDPRKKAAFKKGQWNKYRVLAKGNHIKTWVNGVPVADLVDEKSGHKCGFIGLQVHGIKRGTGPYEVRWRNIKIREIKLK